MTLLYFAWMRERIGKSEETLTLPDSVKTVGALIAWLKERGPGYRSALEKPQAIRVALNQEHVSHEAVIADRDEIALFPPVTGG